MRPALILLFFVLRRSGTENVSALFMFRSVHMTHRKRGRLSAVVAQVLNPGRRDIQPDAVAANEVAVLESNNKTLLKKTPLWYYVLREAAVTQSGEQLGPVGGRIVADTFVRMLKRDGDSYLNDANGFSPFLPSAAPDTFTFADLVIFAGVTQP